MRFTVVALLASALCACQPVPHPFADSAPPPNSPLLTPPDSAGVLVEPVSGAPAAAAHELAAAMAKALRDEDVPASTDARNRGSFVLQGRASTAAARGDMLRVDVAWEMRAANGALTGRQTANATMPPAAWQEGGAAIAPLVTPAAPALAKLIETKTPPRSATVAPLIAIHPASGAPGDGGEALATAMSAALRRAQVPLADLPGAVPSYIVEAKVVVASPIAGKQRVTIAWSLHRPNGGEIGVVRQQNAVAAGSLNHVWGLTAYDAANAAAPGIEALIKEAQRRAPPRPS